MGDTRDGSGTPSSTRVEGGAPSNVALGFLAGAVAALLDGAGLDGILDAGLASALYRVDTAKGSCPPLAELRGLVPGLTRLPL